MDMHSPDQIKVVKRNGHKKDYDRSRIENAVKAAFTNLYNGNITEDMYSSISGIAQGVENILLGKKARNIPVENIQDIVEGQIMASGYVDAARQFVLYRHEKQKSRNLRTAPDSSALADYIFTSKYARWIPELERRETWDEMVDRVEGMHIRRFPELKDRIKKAFGYVRRKRGLPAGRHMQFGGQAVEANHTRGYNCSGTTAGSLENFHRAMFALLSGCGIGVDLTYEQVEKLPAVASEIDETSVKHFTIPDTIEGWQEAVYEVVKSYIQGYLVEFNYSLIRPKGRRLKTSGGRAPGHVPLRKALEHCREVFNNALGRKLKPIEVFDIYCYLADAVVSGGVRRSAAIFTFSPDDGEMMNSKTGTWNKDNPQRQNANISVKMVRSEINKPPYKRVISRMREYGEPGFVFMDNPDYIVNPCGEAGFYPYTDDGEPGLSFCNLTTINGSVMRSEKEFVNACWAMGLIGTLQAAYTDFPSLGSSTEEIVRRDSLLGVSITGMMDNPDICLDPDILEAGAEEVLRVNKEVAEQIGINPAKRVTCIKPEGTASLLLGGVSAGIHPQYARRFFKRVTANHYETPYQHFRTYNPHACEQSVMNSNDDKITFCIQVPDKSLVSEDLTPVGFLTEVLKVQRHWVDAGARVKEGEPHHAVSNTVLLDEDEWEEASDFVWEYRDEFKGVTFMQRNIGSYAQLPNEAVETEEQELKWRYLVENYKPVDYTEMREESDVTSHIANLECSGKGCVLKS